MSEDIYSPFKVVHFPDKLDELRNKIQINPIQVQIIMTNKCNQSCGFCAYRQVGYVQNQLFDDREEMTISKIEEILNDCFEMGVKSILFSGGGEPLVHPHALRAFRYALSLGFDCALITNGQEFTEETAEVCKDFQWVRFSIDSGCAKTYKSIRGVDKFDQVWRNIRYFISMVTDCIIGVGFVVTKENYTESWDCCELAYEIGVDNFRISGAFTPKKYKYFDGFREDAKQIAEECEGFNGLGFTVFNNFNDRLQDVFVGSPQYDHCPIKELITYIGADLNVYYCCVLGYNEDGLIGSIKDTTLKKLWYSTEKVSKFTDHNPIKDCSTSCMLDSKNKFINYCIGDGKHKNFI